MLSTLDIIKLLRKSKNFAGVFPSDRLPIDVSKPCSLIINTDPYYKEGCHWVAIHIDRNHFAHYFDSYGRPPDGNILTFIERTTKRGFSYNKTKYQANESIACGYFCILFVLMANNLKMFYKKLKRCKHLENEIITYVYVKRLLKYMNK